MKLATPHHAGITLHPHVAFDVPNKPADFKLTSLNQPVNHSACAACTKARAHPRSFPLPSPSCVSDISCPPFHLLPSPSIFPSPFHLLPSPSITLHPSLIKTIIFPIHTWPPSRTKLHHSQAHSAITSHLCCLISFSTRASPSE